MIKEVDIEQGRFLLPVPRDAVVKYVNFDEHGNLKVQENKFPTDIRCIAFYNFGEDTTEDLKNYVCGVANKFGVKKIVWRIRPTSYKDTPNFVTDRNLANDCVCYLIVDGEVDA